MVEKCQSQLMAFKGLRSIPLLSVFEVLQTVSPESARTEVTQFSSKFS